MGRISLHTEIYIPKGTQAEHRVYRNRRLTFSVRYPANRLDTDRTSGIF